MKTTHPVTISRSTVADMTSLILGSLPKLRAFAISLCGRTGGRAERADDLVQETVMKALANIRSFVPGSNMTGWLYTILRNEFYSDYRKRRREVQDEDGSHAAKLTSHPDQEGHLHFLELQDAMNQLRPEHREALVLIAASGLSYEEAAALCACAVGTIKSRVHRARLRLTELLASPEEMPEPTSDWSGTPMAVCAIATRGAGIPLFAAAG
jgi:RNA polymerase sigma-70 factor (ECF subfamily)